MKKIKVVEKKLNKGMTKIEFVKKKIDFRYEKTQGC